MAPSSSSSPFAPPPDSPPGTVLTLDMDLFWTRFFDTDDGPELMIHRALVHTATDMERRKYVPALDPPFFRQKHLFGACETLLVDTSVPHVLVSHGIRSVAHLALLSNDQIQQLPLNEYNRCCLQAAVDELRRDEKPMEPIYSIKRFFADHTEELEETKKERTDVNGLRRWNSVRELQDTKTGNDKRKRTESSSSGGKGPLLLKLSFNSCIRMPRKKPCGAEGKIITSEEAAPRSNASSPNGKSESSNDTLSTESSGLNISYNTRSKAAAKAAAHVMDSGNRRSPDQEASNSAESSYDAGSYGTRSCNISPISYRDSPPPFRPRHTSYRDSPPQFRPSPPPLGAVQVHTPLRRQSPKKFGKGRPQNSGNRYDHSYSPRKQEYNRYEQYKHQANEDRRFPASTNPKCLDCPNLVSRRKAEKLYEGGYPFHKYCYDCFTKDFDQRKNEESKPGPTGREELKSGRTGRVDVLRPGTARREEFPRAGLAGRERRAASFSSPVMKPLRSTQTPRKSSPNMKNRSLSMSTPPPSVSMVSSGCRFTGFGCTANVPPSEVRKHEQTCMHQPHYCPWAHFCNFMGSAYICVAHLQSMHPAIRASRLEEQTPPRNSLVKRESWILSEVSGTAVFPDWTELNRPQQRRFFWEPVQFEFDGKTFFQMLHRRDMTELNRQHYHPHKDRYRYYFWLWAHPSVEDCSPYSFEIVFYYVPGDNSTQQKTRRHVSGQPYHTMPVRGEGRVHPTSISAGNMVRFHNREVALLHEMDLLDNIGANGFLTYKLKVFKA